MLKKVLLMICMSLFVINISYANIENDIRDIEEKDLEQFQKNIVIDDVDYKYYVAWFDMNNPYLKVNIVQSNDKIGNLSNIKEFAIPKSDEKILGVINGSFFDMNKSAQLASTWIKNGKIEHISNYGSIFGFDAFNKLILSSDNVHLYGIKNYGLEKNSSFEIGSINHYYDSKYDKIMLFNSNYDGIYANGTKNALIVDDKVEKVNVNLDNIRLKHNEYLLSSYQNFPDLHEGDILTFNYKFFKRNENNRKSSDIEVFFDEMKNALGAGPTLVKNSQISIAEDLEGHVLAKKSKRSMIGMTSDNKLAFVVTDAMTFENLAKLAIELNLDNAINLDGGGSSSLIVDNKIIRNTNRLLSNAIVVSESKNSAYRLKINNDEIFLRNDILFKDGKYFVCTDEILENLYIKYNYNFGNLEFYFNNEIFNIDTNENKIFINSNLFKAYDIEFFVENDKIFIDIEKFIHLLGGGINIKEKSIEIFIDNYYENIMKAKFYYIEKKYELAVEYFSKVLKYDKSNYLSLLNLAKIFEEQFYDNRTAFKYYTEILKYYKYDEIYLNAVKIALELNSPVDAIEILDAWNSKSQYNENVYFYYAKSYYGIDNDKSKDYYEWILYNARNEQYKQEASKKLKNMNVKK